MAASAHTSNASPSSSGYCRTIFVTGYSRFEFSPWTFDGTSIWEEGIAAASWEIPIGAHVAIQGLGRYRIADRGHLGSDGWVDIAVWSRQEAYQLTGRYHACILAADDPNPWVPE